MKRKNLLHLSFELLGLMVLSALLLTPFILLNNYLINQLDWQWSLMGLSLSPLGMILAAVISISIVLFFYQLYKPYRLSTLMLPLSLSILFLPSYFNRFDAPYNNLNYINIIGLDQVFLNLLFFQSIIFFATFLIIHYSQKTMKVRKNQKQIL